MHAPLKQDMPTCAELLARCRAVVCDFDGTLVDSNGIKRRAFEACFPEEMAARAAILAYCGANHHTPRSEKFRHVYEEILGQPYTPAVAAELEAQFDAATTPQIIGAAEIPGAKRFLQGLHRHRLTAALSSTPQEVLRRILAGRGWLAHFDWIRGAPVQKAVWLRTFREDRGYRKMDVLMFGDTQEDALAAREAGCGFIMVGPEVAAADGTILDFRALTF